jgi:hypothetical protein
MLFLEQGSGRDIFQRESVLSKAIALLVRIDPVSRYTPRKPAFNKTGNEQRAKFQAANVGRFKDFETIAVSFRGPECLAAQTSQDLVQKSCQPDRGRGFLAWSSSTCNNLGDLYRANGRYECLPESFEGANISRRFRRQSLAGKHSRFDLAGELELFEQ